MNNESILFSVLENKKHKFEIPEGSDPHRRNLLNMPSHVLKDKQISSSFSDAVVHEGYIVLRLHLQEYHIEN